MKATGYVRRIERLGKVCIPVKLLKSLSITKGEDMVSVSVDGESIVLEKHKPTCAFCFGQERIIDFKGKHVCQKCMTAVARECADQEE